MTAGWLDAALDECNPPILAGPFAAWLLAGSSATLLGRDGDASGPALPIEPLTGPERRILASLRIPKRRHEWLLGRLTAKRLVRAYARARWNDPLRLGDIGIEPAPDGAPKVVLPERCSERARALSLSLSHRDGVALCALSDAAPVGIDLELVEPRTEAFVEDYFTDSEIAQLPPGSGPARDLAVTAIWSAKEAALKACRLGLAVDTRAVDCTLAAMGPPGWSRVEIRWPRPWPTRAAAAVQVGRLQGLWRAAGRFVVTLAQPRLRPDPGMAEGRSRGSVLSG